MKDLFGVMPDGTPVDRVQLEGPSLRVALIGYGAAVQSIELRTAEAEWVNVVLGLTTLAEYRELSPHFGATPGRFAGRIAGARFTLDGVEHGLDANDGPNTRHGGRQGFGKRAWSLEGHGPAHATFALCSPDGDGGFPGQLDVRVRYALEGADLRIDYHATTTRPTVLNLTNHAYFNLAGEGRGDVTDHEITIEADTFVPIDHGGIPLGAPAPVAGSAFDLRSPTLLRDRLRMGDAQLLAARGFDHSFLIRGRGLRPAAMVSHPPSGRSLHVLTTQPALHLYTSNMLTGNIVGPAGRSYRQSDGLCLEAQHLSDSPNRPDFPPTTLRPGQVFTATTIFRFAQI